MGQADVVSELKNYLARTNGAKGQPYLGIIHRLDQPVEGLLVFAKNKNAAAVLTKQLGGQENSGLLNKQYYAVFCGKPSEKEGVLVDYMYKGPDGKAVIVNKKSVAENSEGQRGAKAVLQYRILQTVTISTGEELSLADIHIETGRFHQIRAQLAAIGLHIKGDLKYGFPRSNPDGGIHLHARKIVFIHPVKKEEVTIVAPPPHDPVWDYFAAL